MKKLLLLIAAVASLASCVQNIEGVDTSLGYTTITVGMPESRTSLGAKDENGIYAIYWSEGDKIVANGAASSRMDIGDNQKSATFHFEDSLLVPPYHLTYPYTANSACADGKPTVVFAAEQEYVANSFGVGYAPMCGYVESGEASMQHLAGVLQFTVKGANKLSTIEIIAEEGKALAGEFDVDCESGTLTAINGEVSNKITYTVNQTLTEDGTAFHITVPKGIEGVCKVVLTDSAGQKMNLKWTASNVSAGVVREFKPFAFKGGASFELQEMTSITDEMEVEVPDTWKIYYTATAKVEPYKTDVFGANIVSNVYENGKGVITFDAPVTSIGYYAFYGCTSLTSVTIPDSVTSIGYYAFRDCTSLKEVYYKGDLSAWCKIDFSNSSYSNPCCNGARLFIDDVESIEITIPSDVTEIKKCTFSGCTSLTSVTIPNSVTEIGYDAFRGCTSLTSVTIPDSVTEIGIAAFQSCTSLKEVYYKGDLSAWCNINFADSGCNPCYNGARLFIDDVEAIEITIPSDVTEIKKGTFSGCTSLTSITIPDSVTSIRNAAFWNCTSLTSVTIGNSVTLIGNSAFADCTSLTTITIPDSVTSIGICAFSGCTSLNEVYCKSTTPPTGDNYMFSYYDGGYKPIGCKIYVPEASVEAYKAKQYWSDYADYIFPDATESTNDRIFYTSTDGAVVEPYATGVFGANIVSNVYENGKGVITFDAPVTSIGDWAFTYCSSLTSVTIPDSVTSIGDGAFRNCTSLTNVTIPDGVTSIVERAFYYCTSLTSVTIPDSVTEIRSYAFYNCASLKSVTIPDSVTSIGERAFYTCTSLKEVYCKPTTPPTGGSSMFSNNASGRKIYVPTTSVNAYKAASYWSDYADYIEEKEF